MLAIEIIRSMLKLLTLLLLVSFSFVLRAQDQVIFSTQVVDIKTTGDYYTLNTGGSSGGTEGTPIEVYIPEGSFNEPPLRSQYSRYVFNGQVIPSLTAPNISSLRMTLNIQTDNSGITRRLRVLVAPDNADADDPWKHLAWGTSTFGNGANTDISFELSMGNYCNAILSESPNCASFGSSGSQTMNRLIYIYLDDNTNNGNTNDVTPSSVTGGIFYEFKFSEARPSSSPSIDEVRKGDEQLFISYSGSLINDLFRTIVLVFNSASPCSNNGPIGGFVGQGSIVDYPPEDDAQIFLKNLENNVPVCFTIGYENNWGFVSALPDSVSETPLDIEELLKKESCYLITAGFQREHYILDFYKLVRDQFLLKFSLGKKFVNYYYKTAPGAVSFILNNPFIASLIRFMAYLGFISSIIFCFIFVIFIIIVLPVRIYKTNIH